MVEVKFDVSDLNRALRRYERKLKNLPMDILGQILVNEADEMFETKGVAGTDGKWKDFEPSTIERHPRRAGGQILQDTGATANIQVNQITGFSVTIGSPTVQAGFLAGGTRHMVKRDFFAFRFEDVLDQLGDVALQEFQR